MVASCGASITMPSCAATSRSGASPSIRRPPSSGLDQLAGARVELVLDLADDLLEDVLERDQPDDGAVLVKDQREVATVAAHLAQYLVDAGGLRHARERPRE
jgi:hypothetical protein